MVLSLDEAFPQTCNSFALIYPCGLWRNSFYRLVNKELLALEFLLFVQESWRRAAEGLVYLLSDAMRDGRAFRRYAPQTPKARAFVGAGLAVLFLLTAVRDYEKSTSLCCIAAPLEKVITSCDAPPL